VRLRKNDTVLDKLFIPFGIDSPGRATVFRACPKVWRFSSRADFVVRREVISDFIEKRQTRKSRQSLTAKDAARENARLWDRLYLARGGA
jgi:hypothetical protein